MNALEKDVQPGIRRFSSVGLCSKMRAADKGPGAKDRVRQRLELLERIFASCELSEQCKASNSSEAGHFSSKVMTRKKSASFCKFLIHNAFKAPRDPGDGKSSYSRSVMSDSVCGLLCG